MDFKKLLKNLRLRCLRSMMSMIWSISIMRIDTIKSDRYWHLNSKMEAEALEAAKSRPLPHPLSISCKTPLSIFFSFEQPCCGTRLIAWPKIIETRISIWYSAMILRTVRMDEGRVWNLQYLQWFYGAMVQYLQWYNV